MSDESKPTGRENFRQLSIYVTTDTLARLDQINRREERSMNNLINRFIKDSIEAYWLAKGQPEPTDNPEVK
jgi:hypothetical protein